jgi:hypothetical protein
MWSVPQLQALLCYKKLKTDKWLQLKTRLQLLEKWEEVKHQAVPQNRSVAQASSQSETEASIALLELVGRDEEQEELEVELKAVQENEKNKCATMVALYLP